MDIGNTDGDTANILIREGDDPRELAADFARKHGIHSEQLRDLLAEQIQVNMEAVLKEDEWKAMVASSERQGASGYVQPNIGGMNGSEAAP